MFPRCSGPLPRPASQSRPAHVLDGCPPSSAPSYQEQVVPLSPCKQSGRGKGKASHVCFPLQDHLRNVAENLRAKQSVGIPAPANVNTWSAGPARVSAGPDVPTGFPGRGQGSSSTFHPLLPTFSLFLCEMSYQNQFGLELEHVSRCRGGWAPRPFL